MTDNHAGIDTSAVERLVHDLERGDEYEPLGHDAWRAADMIKALSAELTASREALVEALAQAEATIAARDAEIARLRRQQRTFNICVAALAEIKATVDGHSEQPVKDIIYGTIARISALKETERD